MKKLLQKKEQILISIVVVLFLCTSVISLVSMRQMQGNARVVNYVGIVRGATQKLVKEELMGLSDDALLTRLESILENLETGFGPHDLIVLHDREYLNNLATVRLNWDDLKLKIAETRDGGDKYALFNASQRYFTLVDQTVFSAEKFSEKQVKRNINLLMGVNVVFAFLVIAGLVVSVRALTIKRKADVLSKIAYIDSLTGLQNRAGYEKETRRLEKQQPLTNVAVFMFDMNDLKLVNDFLGHKGGDRLLADFANILQTAAHGRGFVTRYGGDEFVVIFENADEALIKNYLSNIDTGVAGYNRLKVNEIEKISFAVGYILGHLDSGNFSELLDRADKEMYRQKRLIKSV